MGCGELIVTPFQFFGVLVNNTYVVYTYGVGKYSLL